MKKRILVETKPGGYTEHVSAIDEEVDMHTAMGLQYSKDAELRRALHIYLDLVRLAKHADRQI